jgi:uncharacterized protein YdiU (UPF0061 family)
MLREYIISEAMFALGIPTTRSLAVVSTGEAIFRESPLPGAILTRVAASHIRVGTFQFAAAKNSVKALADYSIERHYPELVNSASPYQNFLRAVIARQAELIAKWILVGFIHGVMNTDNMAISGETIDYGPCAFMDAFDPATVFSSIDQNGRYAYGNQPPIAHWNLTRFAETLLPLLNPEENKALEIAKEELDAFPKIFQTHWQAGMRAKLGLKKAKSEDASLLEDFLKLMHQHRADYTNSFRALCEKDLPSEALFRDPSFLAWQKIWTERIESEGESLIAAKEAMKKINPAVIPRNHLVEEALASAQAEDLEPLHRLLRVISKPFEIPENPAYLQAAANAESYKTFCGT